MRPLKLLTLTYLLLGNITTASSALVTVVDQTGEASSTTSTTQTVPSYQEKKQYDSLSYTMPKSALNLKRDFHYDYLNLRITKSKRLRVKPDGTIVFVVYPETLEQNTRSLLGHTKGAVLYVDEGFPKALRMFNTFELEGQGVLEILDQMIAPFYSARNVVGRYTPNKVVRLIIAE